MTVNHDRNTYQSSTIDDDMARAELHDAASKPCHCAGLRCTAHLAADELRRCMPRVVVLCGSTRFFLEFTQAYYDETRAGHIVLSVGFAPWNSPYETPRDRQLANEQAKRKGTDVALTALQKQEADRLHKHKISLADEVLVINPGGYIGWSTASEIEYAELCGKPIRWLEPPRELCRLCRRAFDGEITPEIVVWQDGFAHGACVPAAEPPHAG